jgi:hypothetical protein
MDKFAYEQWAAVGKFASKQTHGHEKFALYVKKRFRTNSPANKDTSTAGARRKTAV